MMGTESMFGSTYASGMVCHDRTCCWCTDLARSAVAINRRMSDPWKLAVAKGQEWERVSASVAILNLNRILQIVALEQVAEILSHVDGKM